MFPSRSGLPSGISVVLPTRWVTRNRVTKAGKLRVERQLLGRSSSTWSTPPLKRGARDLFPHRTSRFRLFLLHTFPSKLEWGFTSRGSGNDSCCRLYVIAISRDTTAIISLLTFRLYKAASSRFVCIIRNIYNDIFWKMTLNNTVVYNIRI